MKHSIGSTAMNKIESIYPAACTKVIVVSGYFDPLHVGHLEMLELAKELGDELVVIVNSDKQAALKKGKSFMHEDDRLKIIKAIRCVDQALLSIDKDETVCKSLKRVRKFFPEEQLIFANGGDRTNSNIPEAAIMKKCNIKLIDGLGEKIRSSSDLTGI